ncbi:hypothetical protein D3C86_1944790 [compost metagenome]
MLRIEHAGIREFILSCDFLGLLGIESGLAGQPPGQAEVEIRLVSAGAKTDDGQCHAENDRFHRGHVCLLVSSH